MTHSSPEIDSLKSLDLAGRLVLPADADWDQARTGWNLAIDQRPAAVVEAASVADVQATVRAARAAGLRVAPQATGHGSEALGALDGAILLKLSALHAVTIDPAAGTARVEAGALAGDVAAAAGEHRLAPALGLAPSVGVAGLTLGGGLGWLSRTHGLACNNVRSFEVVSTSGERVRVDAESDPELFWALRGGGGRMAIVTALEVELHPVPEVSAGMLAWPAAVGADVVEQFRRWTADAPECLSAVFRYVLLPDLEAIPEPIRGRRLVSVAAAYFGTEADARAALAPLRGAPATLIDTFGPIGAADLVRVAGDPEEPGPARGDGFVVSDLTAELAATVVELIDADALAPLSVLELRLLGGALDRAPEGHGALAKLDGRFSVFAGGPVFGPEMEAGTAQRLAMLRECLAPWKVEQELLNSAPVGIDPAKAFDAESWERLTAARSAYDPDGLILSHHAALDDLPSVA
jgi:FAD/FMN-containing dehydrogenase